MDDIQEKLANADPFDSWWPFIISAAVFVVITIRGFMGGKKCPSVHINMTRKWVIVTGANGGIGRELCKELSGRGANLILACRSGAEDKQTVIFLKYLKKTNPKSQLELIQLDLSSFSSIRQFAKVIQDDPKFGGAIDVLINQAGVMFCPYQMTEDDYEMHLQCNYLGHFLLTLLLLPMLTKSEQGRIINVSAHAYSGGRIDFEDPLNKELTPNQFHARDSFSHSKLAIIIWTRYLAKFLQTNGSRVTVNSCSPGLVRGTGHFKRSPIMRAFFARIITYPWMFLFMKNANQGAQTILFLAVEPSLEKVNGEFFNDCEQTEVVANARDDQLAMKLTRESLKAVHVDGIKL